MSVGPEQVSEHVFYLPGGVNAAIVVGDEDKAVLVDTGQDKDHGRRIRKACEHLGVVPCAIINTHAHADHYGGNAYLLGQFDIPVYAPPFEAAIMQNPLLEPIYLFGGAAPPEELLSKWLLAKASAVHHVIQAGPLSLAGLSFDILDTSGHAHRHFSVEVDNVLVAADALFGAAVLAKYPLAFGQDIGRQIESATGIKTRAVRQVVPGHGAATDDLAGLVEANLASFERALDQVFEACRGNSSPEVLRLVAERMDIEMTDLPRYYLNLCTVQAYLSHLKALGRVDAVLKDGQLVWQRRS